MEANNLVDLPVEGTMPVQPPAVPATPPSPPPLNLPSQAKPTVTTKRVITVTEPPRPMSANERIDGNGTSRSNDAPGLHPQHRGIIEYLQQIIGATEAQGWEIQIERVGPARWNDKVVPTGQIENVIPMSYRELHEHIRDLHGGGDFRIKVFDNNGSVKYTAPININVNQFPPIIQPFQAPGAGAPALPGSTGIHYVAEGNSQIEALRMKERLASEAKRAFEAEADYERTKKQTRKELQQESIQEQQQQQAPMVQMLEMQLKQQKEAFEREMSHLKEAVAQPRTDPMVTLMPTLMKMQTDSQQAMMTLIATLLNKPQDTSALEIAKLQAETARESARLQAEASRESAKLKAEAERETAKLKLESDKETSKLALESARKNDKLFEMLLSNQMSNKDDTMTTTLKLMEVGEKRAQQYFEMLSDFRQNTNEDDYDPEAGVGGNLVRLLFSGLKKLASRPGDAAALLGAIMNRGQAAAPGMPPGVTDAQLATVAQQLGQEVQGQPGFQPMFPAQQQQMPRLPRPMQPMPMPPPVTQQIPAAIPLQPVAPPRPQVPATPVPPEQAQVVAAILEPSQVVEMSALVQQAPPVQQPPVVQQVQPVQPVQAVALTGEVVAMNREYIDEAFRLAILDVQAGRQAHEWAEYAADKWPRSVLAALAESPNLEARFAVLQQVGSPEMVKQLFTLLTAPERSPDFVSFQAALDSLIEEHRAHAGKS